MADYRPLVIGTGVTQRMTTGDRIEAGAGVVASSSVPLVLSAGGQGVQVASGDDLQPAANIAFTKETAHTIKVTASTTTNAAGGNLTVAAGDAQGTGTAGNLYLRGGSGSTNGIVYLGDSNTSGVTASVNLTLAAGKSLVGAAGAGGLSLGSMTGDTTLPTGAVTWSGASNKNISITASGSGTVTITSDQTTTLGNCTSSNTVNLGAAALSAYANQTINIGNSNGSAPHFIKIGNYGSTPSYSTLQLFCDQIGFFDVTTPVSKQTSSTETTYNDSGTTIVHTAGKFTGGVGSTGYTVGDIVKALKNYHLLFQ